MASRGRLRLSSIAGLIAIPVLVNLGTGGLPEKWGAREWVFAAVALLLAILLALREPPPDAPPASSATVVEDLARAIDRQWTEEVAGRRLNDPDPLPLAWKPAPAGLTPPLPRLREIALAWWPATTAADREQWADSADDLAGTDPDLADVLLRRVPTRRLVVLGAIGSGKTVALVRLVLRLLELRRPGDPVPVMYSLASWDPTQTGLYEWLEAQLANDHPMLRDPARAGVSWARELIDQHLLLPVLDGFDELPADLRAGARDGLNDALQRRPGLVLSCRTDDFTTVVQAQGGATDRLHAAAAVEIQSLSVDVSQAYLAEDAGDDARWEPVFAAAGTSPALRAAFTTPLQVSLARAIYNPRPSEDLDQLPHPRELANADRFPDQPTIDRHLFAGFVPAAYRQFPGQLKPPTCSAEQALTRLAFLARWLENRPAPEDPARTRAVVDLTWWELRDAVGPPAIGLTAGLLPAVAVGLVAYLGGTLGMGLGIGVIIALAVVLVPPGRQPRQPARRRPETLIALARPRGAGIVAGMAGGFVGGFLGGLAGGLTAHAMRGSPPMAGIMGGLGAGIGAGAIGGPRRGFLGGLAGGVAVGLTAGTGVGVLAGLVDGVAAWLAAGATVALTGLRRPAREVQALHYSKIGLIVGVTVAVAIGAQVWWRAGPQLGLIAGLTVGVLGGLAAGLEGRTVDPTKIAGPLAVLKRDRGTFLMVGALGGLAFGLGAAFGVRPSVGLAAGLTVGLVAACVQSSYGAFVIARLWLALRGDLPWRLMRFLDDAHRLGVLRQVGAAYQFRHIELQRHLARTAPGPAAGRPPEPRREARTGVGNRPETGGGGPS